MNALLSTSVILWSWVGPTINLFPKSHSLTVSCPIMDRSSHANEIKLIFKVREVKRLVGVKAHQDGFKLANSFPKVEECGNFHETKINANLMF